ncbi:putative F-box/FBD/LRR-repeat protein At1g78840 [Neltuma alba]|uniref:putative F-box/FBD/LRR-repeat protein At1g78840 n=1 Tax=Neltuma alba TaxID=207710 RepID=UPI0010A540E9|nr:putative F-box/FBD/LRR-repeat protein At1g78840 [Prosopis alba]XP_028756316.1 putative F-box/FBD/LRR-repeat protein At1g78840 [Prosopis alba]
MIKSTGMANSIDCSEARVKRVEFRGSSRMSKKLKRTMLASHKGDNDAAESQGRLGDLPDNLIHHILSFMETKDAIRTSFLSRRWRYMWTSVPCLNFNSKSFSRLADFKRFVKRVLSQRDTSHIKALTYCRFGVDYATDQSLLNKVIEFATSHGVEEIRINLRGKSSGSPPIEIPSSLFACRSLKRIELKDCHPTNVPPSVGCKSLEMLHLEHFPLHPGQANSSNPFSSIQKLFGFTKLTTLHLNSFTLSCTGTGRLDPFADCVNLKNLHLSEICFKSDLNPRDFVISAPQLSNLTLVCNRLKCKLVVAAPQLTNFSYIYSSPCALFDFGLPSLDDLTIDIHELHDQLEIYQRRHREETLHGFINVLWRHHNVEAVKLSFHTVMATCGAAALLKCEDSSFIKSKSLNLGVGSTYKIFISDVDRITAYYRSFSQHTDFEISTF